MKPAAAVLILLPWIAAAAAPEKPPVVSEKLSALLSAKGEDGKPVISPAQRACFDGLDDHLKGLLNKVVEAEIVTAAGHLGLLLSLELRPQKMELLLQDNCVLCHTDAESHSPPTLFTLSTAPKESSGHMNLRDYVEEIHFRRGLSCAGCHGGDAANSSPDHAFVKEWPEKGRQEDRRWIPDFCARCHSDPTFMNRFNPAMATDQLTKFKDSPHGKLLLDSRDMRAPQCVSCHGVHGIRGASDPLSKVYARRVPETCGACHADPKTMAGFKLPDGKPLPTNQLDDYRKSVHGRALLERGDLGAPACNDCHGNHAAMPVGLSSVSQSCSLCHAGNASLFDGSKHKQAFEKHDWPQCAKCHGEHAIAKTSDAMLGDGPGSLCVKCHEEFAASNPECRASARHFHATITRMDQAWKHSGIVAEEFAMKGLDVEPIQNQLNELGDTLKKARSHIHSFSRNSFEQTAAPGGQAVEKIDTLVEEARREYRFRQTGMLASIVLMGLLMVTIYLKLRRLEE